MRRIPFLLLAVLTAFTIGCGKDYKPEANPKGGGEHTPIDIDLPRPSPKPSSGGPGRSVASAPSLQGQWRLTKFDLTSNEADNAMINQMILKDAPTVNIAGNSMTFQDPKGKSETATVRLKGGREIDLNGFAMFGPAGTALGIYDLSGDTLRMALQTSPNGPRPTEFRASNVSLKDLDKNGDAPHVIVMHLRRIGGKPVEVSVPVAAAEDDEDIGMTAPPPPRPKPPNKGFEAPPKKAPPAPVVPGEKGIK